MAIPSRQIGWSTRDNLLWQISKQLENLICVKSGGCGTTTTTTSEAKVFEDLVYRAEKSSNACDRVGGGVIFVSGNGTTFCNSTILIAAGFSALPPGELFISYNGQVRTANHGSGQNFITFTTGCSNCP